MTTLSLTQLFPASFLSDAAIPKTLGEEFALCDNGNMVFHWADFHETCDSIKEQMDNDPSLKEDFLRKEASLFRLSLIPIWIRTKNKVHQMTMFELYQKHILNQSQLMSELDPFGPIEVSFISGTGPFKSMSVAECFNSITYRDFVLVSLLQGKLPRRDYRIRLKSKVLVEYGQEFSQARLVNLEQMTTKGLLFSMDSDFYLKELSQLESMRVLIDIGILSGSMGKSLPDLQAHLSQNTFNLLYSSRKEDAIECSLAKFSGQSSFDFYKSKKVYLFITYAALAEKGSKSAEGIQKFVEYSKTLVRDHYRGLGGKLKTA